MKNNELTGINLWEQELNGHATLFRIERDGRFLSVVSAEHFSEQAARYFQDEIVPEISKPRNWYFLIEGKDSNIHECAVMKK